MSWRVYHGYRLPASMSIPVLCRDLRRRAEPVYRELAIEAVGLTALLLCADDASVEKVADAVSHGQVKEAKAGWCPTLLSQAAAIVDAVQERLRRPAALRVPAVFDLVFSVAFVADVVGSEWTYALLYTDRQELEGVWAATPGVEPWPWWDNTDGPDDVTEAEWDERGDVWRRVLGDDPPGHVGCSWEARYRDLWLEAAISEKSDAWLTVDAALRRLEAISAPGFFERQNELAERFAGPALAAEPLP